MSADPPRLAAEQTPSAAAPEALRGWFAPVCGAAHDEQDAVELARRVAATDVGGATLGMLESAFDELAVDYTTTPPAALLSRIRRQLEYVHRLLGGRATLAEHRRLLVAGAWLSLLGATVHIDLNQDAAANARLRTAAKLAQDAGEPEIRAWCFETEAWRNVMRGDHARAAELSRAAIALAPAGGSAAVQATAQLGRASARLGNAADTYAALDAVHRMVAPMARPEVPEHHYRYDPDKALAYTATTLAWLGDPAAEQHARDVIARLDPHHEPVAAARRRGQARPRARPARRRQARRGVRGHRPGDRLRAHRAVQPLARPRSRPRRRIP